MLRPKPEQRGIAADEQIRQNDFHGRVGGLRRDVQRIRDMAQTTTWLATTQFDEGGMHTDFCKAARKKLFLASPNSINDQNRCGGFLKKVLFCKPPVSPREPLPTVARPRVRPSHTRHSFVVPGR